MLTNNTRMHTIIKQKPCLRAQKSYFCLRAQQFCVSYLCMIPMSGVSHESAEQKQ